MRVFLSHQFDDKPVVEPIAIALRDKLGATNVFYDAWSIKPGEGIIEKMNEGMTAPDFVFFFVSAKSLASGMVKLEWHNALYQAANGQTQLIPVRVDGVAMPALLMQSVYIDLHNIGIPAAQQQILQIVTGSDDFRPKHAEFSNLTAAVSKISAHHFEITVIASHLSEHAPTIVMVTNNTTDEGRLWIKGCGGVTSSNYIFPSTLGKTLNGFTAGPIAGDVIKPKFPRIYELRSSSKPLELVAVVQQIEPTQFKPLPTTGL
ncbi:TIR domain-containing protein [Sphingobium sp. SCG-1]|uniref:toll/interleukin-1 receptor domain-containing protein n=1 Tax=Sphingobium sp. SCG-1 TaxID=2072936 RepID=UPI000CD6AD4E|nr:toll/interleukin-1 receptor domain-containing protein [Sphingobium sp. SCG-1]AUW57085.1 TIR domain-containing protein [Sphingobium sp. SCG-1]